MFEWYNLSRNSSGKKCQRTTRSNILCIYECFDQYCKLASIFTRHATFATVMIGFPLIARDEIPMLKCLR